MRILDLFLVQAPDFGPAPGFLEKLGGYPPKRVSGDNHVLYRGFICQLDGAFCSTAKRGSHTGYVLRQQSTYVNENDAYCETDFELDSDRFDDQVDILAGEPGAETVKKCLMSAGADRKTNLRNKAFTVRFDDKGSITVIEA